MNQKLISIIVPVYNASSQLRRMLDSVLVQTYKNWEIIIVNDGSTDDSEPVIKEYIDERIRYFSQSNAGPSVARNLGIKKAEGVYLAFIDADDWVSPFYLEKMVDAMINSEADLVCAGYYEVNKKFPKGLQLHDFGKEFFNLTVTKHNYQANLFNGVSGVLWGKLFKKEIFSINEIELHPDLKLSEDLVAVLKYSTFIKTAYIVPDALYYYNRINEDGLSGQLKLSNYKGLEIFLKEIEKFRSELYFLDLDTILRQVKFNFIIKLLKDHVHSRKEFYSVSISIVNTETSYHFKMKENNKLGDKVLTWIFNGKIFKSWTVLKTHNFLRKIKNG